jgi:dihydrodipicolinate synthase/N-acetylneuraminate lyase
VVPIAPTPFRDNGDLDLDSQRRVFDCMIDQGVDGICILANYSEQFLLSDEERSILLDLALSQVRGRVPVIVTCSHFSTRIAAERARRAAAGGADMLMLHAALPQSLKHKKSPIKPGLFGVSVGFVSETAAEARKCWGSEPLRG